MTNDEKYCFDLGRMQGYKECLTDVRKHFGMNGGLGFLPHPVNGTYVNGYRSDDFLAKCKEEFDEMEEAYHTLKGAKVNRRVMNLWRKHFLLECTDLITATTGFLEYMGFDETMRQVGVLMINKSNSERNGGTRFKENCKTEDKE